MNCQICRICIVGESYELPNGICQDCGTLFGSIGTYLGMNSNHHIFRLHNSKCPKCGAQGNYGQFDCDDFDGVDVTNEFEQIKQPHWIGKSPNA